MFKKDAQRSMGQFREALLHPFKRTNFTPYQHFVDIQTIDPKLGSDFLALNKVGALLLAGGMGSRLRFERPKGCFPIWEGKTLYQLAAEGILVTSQKVGKPLQLAIMTSELTDKETRDYFKEKQFFGLDASQVDFFCQESWPLLDLEGQPFLEAPEKLAKGPSGNGSALALFAKSPILKKWQSLNIEILSLFPIDNPLANPFDERFIAHHVQSKAEVSIAVGKKRDKNEKVGVVGLSNGILSIIEYMELNDEQLDHFFYANLALFLFSMPFVERVQDLPLPIHAVKKAVKKINDKGVVEFPLEPNAYKFEQFIFDLLDYSKKSEAVVFDRASCFAPLKEWEGLDGVASVRKALSVKRSKIKSD